MTVSIRQLHPLFAGEVHGADLRRPLTPDEVAAIEAGMDRYAVLVFHDQPLADEQPKKSGPPKTVEELARRSADASKKQLKKTGKAVEKGWSCLTSLFQDC